MIGFREYLSLLMPGRRYKNNYALYKGQSDAKVNCPPWRDCDRTADRLHAMDGLAKEYPDLPETSSGLSVWLQKKQAYFLGYLAEIMSGGHEFLFWTLARLHKQDATIKARSCVLKAQLPELEEDLRLFKEIFPEYRSRRPIPPIISSLVITLLVIVELPLNIVAFRLFGENDLLTAAVALVIGIVISIVGHFIGVTFKRPSRSKVDLAVIALSIVVVVSTIIGVGKIRTIYLKSMGLTSDPAVELFFYVFQFFFFTASIFLSYNASDLYIELQEKKHALARAILNMGAQRKQIRNRLRGPVKSTWATIGELKASYTMENANSGGPLRTVSDVPTIILNIPDDFDVLDDDCPEEIMKVISKDDNTIQADGPEPVASALGNSEVSSDI